MIASADVSWRAARATFSEMEIDRGLVEQLTEAVEHRTIIGQALGILMERFDMGDAEAFAYLSRCSQNQNRKLYAIAVELVVTRELPQAPEPKTQRKGRGTLSPDRAKP
jgi:AmiR/NasT family two-component response regulator